MSYPHLYQCHTVSRVKRGFDSHTYVIVLRLQSGAGTFDPLHNEGVNKGRVCLGRTLLDMRAKKDRRLPGCKLAMFSVHLLWHDTMSCRRHLNTWSSNHLIIFFYLEEQLEYCHLISLGLFGSRSWCSIYTVPVVGHVPLWSQGSGCAAVTSVGRIGWCFPSA